MQSVINLNHSNFEQALSEHKTVVVDFWAPWCAPCVAFSPVYEAAAAKHPGVVFAKVNVDEEQALAAEYQVRSIPTLKVFRSGDPVDSVTGAIPAAQLDEVIVSAANNEYLVNHHWVQRRQCSDWRLSEALSTGFRRSSIELDFCTWGRHGAVAG